MLDTHQKDKERNRTLIASLMLLACFTSSFSVVASNDVDLLPTEVFELGRSENLDYFSQKEPLVVVIPQSFNQDKMKNITIELDSVDITEMVQIANGKMVYSPLQAMLVESHELRITEYTDEGDINELGVWHFNVRMSELFEEYSFSADTQLNSNYRIAEKNNDSPLPDRFQNDANSQVGFKIKNGNWHAEGQFDLNYTSVAENRPSHRTIENSEFLIKMGNQFVNATIGHQNIGQSSLIMDNFRRRGVSIEGKIPSINSTITGFSLSSLNLSGFGHGLGISDSQQRVKGYSFSTNPIAGSPKLFNLSTTWISGKGNDGSNFIANFDDFQNPNEISPASEEGSAWTISTDSLLFEDKLRIRAEYAETEFNFNPLNDLNAEKDSAENFLVTYSDYTQNAISWNAGLNYQRIGTYFKSLANRGLPSDKQLSKLFAGIQWNTVGIQVSGEEQKDNLSEMEQLPETITQLNSINVNWSPQLADNNSLLGTPNFAFGYNEQNQRQQNLPLDYFFPEADNQMANWQASGSFNYKTNSWGVTFMNTSFTDKSGVQNNTDTDSINLFANFTFDDIGSLSPSIQFDHSKDEVTQLTSTGVTYSIQSMFTLIPHELDGTVDLILNKNETNDLLTRGENLAMNLALNWHAREATANQVGLELALGGTYNNFEDRIFTPYSSETYRIYLTATFTFPMRIGQSD